MKIDLISSISYCLKINMICRAQQGSREKWKAISKMFMKTTYLLYRKIFCVISSCMWKVLGILLQNQSFFVVFTIKGSSKTTFSCPINTSSLFFPSWPPFYIVLLKKIHFLKSCQSCMIFKDIFEVSKYPQITS